MDDMALYLESTPTMDFDREPVREYAQRAAGAGGGLVDKAVRLYYAVRDDIRYDPYTSVNLTVEGLRASTTLETRRGWCVAKAILLAACCRAVGIPARLGFADVRNHLTTSRMRELMKTDVFFWHGYASLYLEGKWVKATPAFNIELCTKFRLAPLEFDGRSDSIYHPFDLQGNRHMEYLAYRGEFADVPIDAIRQTFLECYGDPDLKGPVDFDAEVEREVLEG